MKKLYTRCTAALCSVIKKSNLRLGMLKGAHRYVIPLLLFLMSMVTVPVLGQNTATVADGTVTNAYIPFYGLYLDAARYSQVIYPESMLPDDMVGATITSLTFYPSTSLSSTPNWDNELTVRVGVSSDALYTTSSRIPVANLDLVATINPMNSIYAPGMVTITFDNPYLYTGGNLVLDMNWDEGAYYNGVSFYGVTTGVNTALHNGTSRYDFVPKTDFTYTGGTITCVRPSGLNSTAVTSSSATLNWANDGSISAWDIYYSTTSTAPEADAVPTVIGVNVDSYAISGLSSNTTYYFWVRSDCGSETSLWSAMSSFTTLCAIYSTPFFEDFSGTSYPPGCWSRYFGLASAAFAGVNPTVSTSGWVSTTVGVAMGKHAKVNIYGTDCKYWLVTPEISLQSGDVLEFEVAWTSYNAAAAVSTMSGDDRFMVLLSTDGGSSWSATDVLLDWDSAMLRSLNYLATPVTVNLTGYSGDVKIAFYGESTVSGGDNDFHVGNVYVGEPRCSKPYDLTTSALTNTTATINWNLNGSATGFNAKLIQVGVDTVVLNSIVTSNLVGNQISYALSGLLPNTSYKLMVQSVCGTETSDWSVALDFVTKCNLVTVTQNEPYFENFDSYEGKGYSTIGVMPDCWSRAYYGSSAGYAPHVYNSYAQSAPNSLVMYVTSSTSYSNGDGKVYLFMPEFTNGLGGLILTFYGRTYSTTYGVLALGYVMNDDSETFVELTTVPLTTTITKYKYDLRGYTIPMGARLAYRFVNTSTSTAYCAIDNVLLMLPNVETEILGMSVALPAGSQVGAAQIDEENNTVKMIVAVGTDLTSIAPAFTLSDFACAKVGGVTQVSGVTVNDFTNPVIYTIQAEDSVTTENWTVTVVEESCIIPKNLNVDSVSSRMVQLSWEIGDEESAWQVELIRYDSDLIPVDTAYVNVTTTALDSVVNGVVYVTLPLTGRNVDTYYTCEIKAVCNEWEQSVWTVSGLSFVTPSICPIPTDLVINDITRRTALISWSAAGSETEWHVVIAAEALSEAELEVAIPFTVSTASYQASLLTRGTTYYVYVRAACGGIDGNSPWLSGDFTTKSLTECVIVGNEASTSTTYYPLSNYNYAYTQLIYTAAEIGESGMITKIALYKNATGKVMNNIKVSMAHSTQGTFASTSAWVAEADFTEVFNGTWNMPVGVGWYEVELQTPFEYNGTDNLVVSVSNAHGAYSGTPQFRYTSSTDMVLYKNSDSDATFANYPTTTGTRTSSRANMQFCFVGAACPDPSALTVKSVNGTTAKVGWHVGGGDYENSWNLIASENEILDFSTISSSTPNILWFTAAADSAELIGLAAQTDYYLYLQSACQGEGNDDGSSNWVGTNLSTKSYTLSFNANGGVCTDCTSKTMVSSQAIGTLPTPTRSGYTFNGWVVGTTAIDASTVWNFTTDTTAMAQWIANVYTLTWDANGGVCGTGSQSVTYDAVIGELPTPTRAGYTFAGWELGATSIDATTMWSYDMDSTATAQWTALSYTLTLNGNGGTVSPSSMTVTSGEAIGALPTPTRAGYTFDSWKIGNEVIDATTLWSYAMDSTAVAQWTANTYTLTLNANGGTVTSSSVTVTYGEAIGTLPTPTYTGHVFTGWQVGSDVVDATTVWNFTMDTTAVAEWTSNVYTLTLDADGGTVSPSSLVVAYGVAIGELPIPGRTGYTFDGWKVGADVVTATTVWNYMMDSTAVAQWTANTYTLTLNANGGTVSSNSLSVTYDAAIGTLPTPTQSGYTFTGWQVGSTVVDASTVWNYTVDTTAVAQWTAITYTLTWDANGGTCGTASQSVTYGAAIGELPTPTRTGYTFSGWNLGSVAISATTIWNYAMDSTATAQWTANSYTLTLNGNSGTVTPSSMTVTYGVAIGTLPTPTRSGYTFTGWKIGNDVIDATTVWNTAADATADAQWLAQNYTLNLDANGGTVSQTTMTVSYGAAIGTLPTPVRLGYTFTGWKIGGDDIDALTVWSYTTDSTAVAQWTAGTFTLTLDANGGTVSPSSMSVTFGVAMGTLPTPTRSGYTFVGWEIGAEAIDASTVWSYTADETATAQWMANTYTLTLDPNGGVLSECIVTVTFDEIIGALPTPTKAGYLFDGWVIGAEGIDSATVWSFTEDKTAVASWAVESGVEEAFILNVYVRDGHIVVPCDEGMMIEVYNALGQRLHSAPAMTTETSLYFPANQVYIVRVGKAVVKVRL